MDQWNIFMINNVFEVKNSPYRPFIERYYTYNNSTSSQIQKRLKKAINDYKYSCLQDPITAAAQLHLDLVNIHPYEDANGRTARIVLNIALKQAGYPSIIVYNKHKYTQAIKQSLRQIKHDKFIEYVKKQICKQTELYNDQEFKEGQILKDIADNCEFDCSQEFFKVSSQKFNL